MLKSPRLLGAVVFVTFAMASWSSRATAQAQPRPAVPAWGYYRNPAGVGAPGVGVAVPRGWPTTYYRDLGGDTASTTSVLRRPPPRVVQPIFSPAIVYGQTAAPAWQYYSNTGSPPARPWVTPGPVWQYYSNTGRAPAQPMGYGGSDSYYGGPPLFPHWP